MIEVTKLMRLRKIALYALVIMGVFCLTGCGDDSTTPDTESGNMTETVTETTLGNVDTVAKEKYHISNPRIDSNGIVTWDCVCFGNYYITSGSDTEPIKWRVLSVEGDDAFLMSDTSIECMPYNFETGEVTWETCTLRSWLNGYEELTEEYAAYSDYPIEGFLKSAFTEEEQAAIKVTKVINNDNPDRGTDGGNDTEDKIYLLSIEEACKAEYGFCEQFDKLDKAREVNGKRDLWYEYHSAYTSNAEEYEGNIMWWLRSPGSYADVAAYVNCDGMGYCAGEYVNGWDYTVRPVLHLDLTKPVWGNAGTVTSED